MGNMVCRTEQVSIRTWLHKERAHKLNTDSVIPSSSYKGALCCENQASPVHNGTLVGQSAISLQSMNHRALTGKLDSLIYRGLGCIWLRG